MNAHIAFAQETEPAMLQATYKFTYKYDKDKDSKPLITEVVLRIGASNSSFRNSIIEQFSSNRLPKNLLPSASMDNSRSIKVVGQPVAFVTSKLLNNATFYQVPSKNKLVEIAQLGFQEYEIEMPLPEIKWEILKERKKIDSFLCIKAIGNFGGRNYTAWFAPDLPFRYGPWKFSGLPGLILEISDSKQEVTFSLIKLTRPERDYIIYNPYRPVSIDERLFNRTKARFEKDILGASQAQLQGGARFSEVTFIDSDGKIHNGKDALQAIREDQKIVISNPVELKTK